MRLGRFDLYVLPLCPIGLVVNRPVFPLTWLLMWRAAKRYAVTRCQRFQLQTRKHAAELCWKCALHLACCMQQTSSQCEPVYDTLSRGVSLLSFGASPTQVFTCKVWVDIKPVLYVSNDDYSITELLNCLEEKSCVLNSWVQAAVKYWVDLKLHYLLCLCE